MSADLRRGISGLQRCFATLKKQVSQAQHMHCRRIGVNGHEYRVWLSRVLQLLRNHTCQTEVSKFDAQRSQTAIDYYYPPWKLQRHAAVFSQSTQHGRKALARLSPSHWCYIAEPKARCYLLRLSRCQAGTSQSPICSLDSFCYLCCQKSNM
jgi:hypothetical protein